MLLPRGAIVALSVAAFGSGMSLRVMDAMLPRLAAEFSLTLGAAASVITAFAVAYRLAQLLFGPLGDRFGKYRVVALVFLLIAAWLLVLSRRLPLQARQRRRG